MMSIVVLHVRVCDACDWLGCSIKTYAESDMCMVRRPDVICYHKKFSYFFRISSIYEAIEKHTDHYAHTFLLALSDRDYTKARLVKNMCDTGWKICLKIGTTKIEPVLLEEIDCPRHMRSHFSARTLRFARIYRVSFESPQELLRKDAKLVLENGCRTAEILVACICS